MFCVTLKLLVETPEQPSITSADFDYIQPFLKILGYQGPLERGMHRTVRAIRTPNLDVVQKRRKGKRATGESSSPRPSLKIRIMQQKPSTTTPLPPCDDQERDDIIEATQLSLALNKTVKVYEEQQNVAADEKKLLRRLEKLVEGEDESDADEFADTVFLCDEDSGNRLELRSHKDKPEEINDDDDKTKDVKHDDAKHDDDDNDDEDHNDH
ncbi:hypothetical protein Tco_0381202 [Tanacetum coccineum]